LRWQFSAIFVAQPGEQSGLTAVYTDGLQVDEHLGRLPPNLLELGCTSTMGFTSLAQGPSGMYHTLKRLEMRQRCRVYGRTTTACCIFGL
tara:strand:+ start:7024 stop:7293 length:270 start_codon:yes stop_codon:yes gene_type:complete